MAELPLPKFEGVLRCGKLDAQGRSEFEAKIDVVPYGNNGEHEVAYEALVHGTTKPG